MIDIKAFRAIQKLTHPVAQRAALAAARCLLKIINDALPLQTLQVEALAEEVRSGVERMQEYGFTSVPLSGCRGVAIFVGGDRSNGIVIATDDVEYRKKGMLPGEVAVYNNEGDYILLKNGGGIEITTLHAITLNAPDGITVNSSNGISVSAPTVTVSGDVIASGVSLKNHTHTGCQGGSTGSPN
ncbi:MAG: phage baseplate assembly protein V [Synergistaceae bacterium]